MRTESMRWTAGTRAAVFFGLAAFFFLAVAPAGASPARFTSTGDGFVASDVAGLPTIVFDDAEAPFLMAGEAGVTPNLDVEFTGSGGAVECILPTGSNVCQATTFGLDSTPFSILQSWTITSVNSPAIEDQFTLFITILGATYQPGEVVVELNPLVPLGLDTSAVPGFVWNETFDPFVHVEDVSFQSSFGVTYDFLGWTVREGDTITFRVDVLTGANGRGAPSFLVGAIPLVVPEPGTAMLFGLGLAGLVVGGRKRE